jgi:hypothetical protein
LEGFPNTRADAEILVSNGFYFDAAVHLKVLPEVACQRLLPKFRQEQEERLAKSANPTERGGMNEESLKLTLIDAIEKDVNQSAEVISLFQSLSVAPPIIEIDANKYIRPVAANLKAKLAPLTADVGPFYYNDVFG